MWLSDFRVHRPHHETEQKDGLGWLARAHARAQAHRHEAGAPAAAGTLIKKGEPFEAADFEARIRRVMDKVACGPDRIAARGHFLDDFTHDRFREMEVYRLDQSPHGTAMGVRSRFYERTVDRIFQEMYAKETSAADAPSHLLHVTCTGYVSPSGAQKIIAAREWGAETIVTHAYHMGCYASVPAVRMARGFLASEMATPRSSGREKRADIVHTELCTIHLDPSDHSPEQLVVQSLFADGAIRYSLHAEAPNAPRLEVLALDEVIASGSVESMSWVADDYGLRMTLGRDVPERIAADVGGFVAKLMTQAKLDFATERGSAIFAVHPGGPKIIDRVKSALELSEAQIAHGRSVLLRYGNMSSATLPHVWSDLLADPSVKDGTLIISMAFGPGLTLAGGVFRVCR